MDNVIIEVTSFAIVLFAGLMVIDAVVALGAKLVSFTKSAFDGVKFGKFGKLGK